MQEREYTTPSKKCALKFSSLKQLKRAKMGKRLRRVIEGDITKTVKKLVFRVTE